MIKNTGGQSIGAQMITAADGSAFTGAVTVYVCGDAGTQAVGSVGSGACTHEGNGYHTYAPAQAETNYSLIAFTFTGAGAIPATVQVQTSLSDGLDAAGVRAAIGMAAADLDTQLDALSDQVGTIGSGTGAALNFAASADNTSAPIEGVSFVGSQVNTFASTSAEDGTRHELTDSGGTPDLDIVYRFDIGAGRNAAKLVWKGYVTNGDTVTVQVFNGSTWDTRATITGTASVANVTRDIPLLAPHTGTGANAGRVLLRLVATGQSAIVVRTDELLVAGVAVGMSAGYQDGAVWVDTLNGVAGTTPFVHGVADAPASTWAEALAIAAAVGLSRFHLIAGSSITLTADCSHCTLLGDGLWHLDLGNQNITDAFILRASVSGTASGADAIFEDCQILPDASTGPAYFIRCGIATTSGHSFQAAAPGQYVFADCLSLAAGSATPYFDFSGTGSTTGAHFRRWAGGANVTGDANVVGSLEVLGGGQTIATGGGSWEVRGTCRELALILSGTSVVRFAGVTGPVSVAGTAGTVRLYGVTGVVTDASGGFVTIDQQAVSRDTIDLEVDEGLTPIATRLEQTATLASVAAQLAAAA